MSIGKPNIQLTGDAASQSELNLQSNIGRSRKGLADRQREQRRRQGRRTLIEALEHRHLMAGPNLVGIQPNESSLLVDGSVLNTSPRELVFKFDDNSKIDAATLDGIRITRSGDDAVFESARATSDLGTNGAVLLEFRAVQPGTAGEGLVVKFTSSTRTGSETAAPKFSVANNVITIDLNKTNDAVATTIRELIAAVDANTTVNQLLKVYSVSGSTSYKLGTNVPTGTSVTLRGANAADAISDLGTNNAVRVRFLSATPGADGRGTQVILQRVDAGGPANPLVLVSGNQLTVRVNSHAGNETTVAQLLAAINSNPSASRIVVALQESGVASTIIGNRTGFAQTLTLTGASDVSVKPGYVGIGNSPNEVVFRFAETLPNDKYQIDIFGTGIDSLTNVAGEAFNNGHNLSRQFSLNLGPQVLAVVPEPIQRTSSGLVPLIGVIDVSFNDDALLIENDGSGKPTVRSAENPAFYQLIFTGDTVTPTDDRVVNPTSVSYDRSTNIARLTFAGPLSRLSDGNGGFLTGAAHLRIGSTQSAPPVPVVINAGVDQGDSSTTAFSLGDLTSFPAGTDTSLTKSVQVTSEIKNTVDYGLTLPGADAAGIRSLRPDDPSRLTRPVPLDFWRKGADSVNGISVIQYNFPSTILGVDPTTPGANTGRSYFNLISETQRQRVREVLSLFSTYLGVQFVEKTSGATSNDFFSIVVGDLQATNPTLQSGVLGLPVSTADTNGDGRQDLVVLDFQDFDQSVDDQFGGEFFRGAMLAVGQLLGYGYADSLPQPVTQSSNFVFNPGTDNEPTYPSVADIVNGQYLYRPDSTDIDLYKFTLASTAKVSIQTFAERLTNASLLDTNLRLYRKDSLTGKLIEISQNDDYFSNDSLIELSLTPGEYYVGVSSSGNNSYDPNTTNSGFGGRSEGSYGLHITTQAAATQSITDTTQVPLDGDGDGKPGGLFDFWFVPSNQSNTLYVDKAVTGTGTGTLTAPFGNLSAAIAAATPGTTIRVVANGGADNKVSTPGDNLAYEIGVDNVGVSLPDGASLDIPKGIRLVIDAGAIFKMRASRIGVGSTAPLLDKSDAAIQVLGTPSIIENGLVARDSLGQVIPGSVYFTSYNDSTIGKRKSNVVTPAPKAGDWGGIDLRSDLDATDSARRNRENEGVFLNHIQYADLRYGGGQVRVDGHSVVVSPIELALTRATIINSRISLSADAAIAATPDTFAETRFDEPFYQQNGAFIPTVSRVGPEIHGNHIVDNTINGLFVRISTRTGDVLQPLTSQARFDDTDIVHVITENLVVKGTAGGPVDPAQSPSGLGIGVLGTAGGGNIPAGTYVYRLSYYSATSESAASSDTARATLSASGQIKLSQLPTVPTGSGFTQRRLYRATVALDGVTIGPFAKVADLNGTDTTYVDRAAAGTTPLSLVTDRLSARLDASLKVDPGTIIKLGGARIDVTFGADLIAEGSLDNRVVMTSLKDKRFGAGGTFNTNSDEPVVAIEAGDWGGIYVGETSSANLDRVTLAGAGGTTRIEGGFASFNPIEVHQGKLRLANSRLETNADGRGFINTANPERVGRGTNANATVFVRGAQPIIVNNDISDSAGASFSFDVNSLTNQQINDPGRSTGTLDADTRIGNYGPLVSGNRLTNNEINGLNVRGGVLATEGVWDDTDIVHVLTDTIEIPNQHIYGGLRLYSDARASLVVKALDGERPAAIIAGGTLLSAQNQFVDTADRTGGALVVSGTPDFPVVFTSLYDSTVGAGFDRLGRPQNRTVAVGFTAGASVRGQLTLVQPDSDVFATAIGPFGVSTDALGVVGTGNVQVQLPNGATVEQAYLHVATRTFVAGNNGEFRPAGIGLAGATVPLTFLPNVDDTTTGINFGVGFADVTSILKTFTAGQSGIINVPVDENVTGNSAQVEGVTLTVIYRDNTLPTRTVLVLNGGLTSSQSNRITFSEPINTSDPNFVAEMRLGISFSTGNNPPLTPQTSFVNINGTRLTSSAGGFDDGALANGQLITYGGIGDSAANPVAPTDVTSPDDESYTLTPLLANGITDIVVQTENPSNDDSIFLTTFIFSGIVELGPSPSPGDWNGIVIREAANDRNVPATAEIEPDKGQVEDSNAVPAQAQFLGELSPNLQSGDENRRLGFIVDGTITRTAGSTNSNPLPADIDVYSFIAEAGTQVWLDIDRTDLSFDSVVELINANGQTLALSDDSLAESRGDFPLQVGTGLSASAVRTLNTLPIASGKPTSDYQDTYSKNPRDAGLSVVLPGNPGDRFLYHVRVRASSVASGASRDQLQTNFNGLTTGTYRLQVRLGEADESPGTQLRYSDVRYANKGIQVIGQPLHNPIVGDEYETAASNDTLPTAQPLGLFDVNIDANSAAQAGPLVSDQLAKNVSGALSSATDVDWYQFDLNYQNITRDGSNLFLSTVFDIDYADGFARGDIAIYVFNNNGQLVLAGTDSNVADDLPTGQNGTSSNDLSRGSAGTHDPFIGSAELAEGHYFVAVVNQSRIPNVLDQFRLANSTNPLLRLEPVDSISRIAEDHIDTVGGGTATTPTTPLFNGNASAVPYTFNDMTLYALRGGQARLVNPFTGVDYGNLGGIVDSVTGAAVEIDDFAFSPNGELFGYSRPSAQVNADLDNSFFYYRINTENGTATQIGLAGLQTFQGIGGLLGPTIAADDGFDIRGMTIISPTVGYIVGNRPVDRRQPPNTPQTPLQNLYFQNILYAFNPQTGVITSFQEPLRNGNATADGAGTDIRERGTIQTTGGATSSQLVVPAATRVDLSGQTTALIPDNAQFAITALQGGSTFRVALDSGPVLTFSPTPATGKYVTDGLSFALTRSGTTQAYEFETGPVITLSAAQVLDGASVTIQDTTGKSLVFEFDNNNALSSATSIRVPLVVGETDATLAQALADAITNANFGVDGFATPGQGRVDLTGDSTTVPVSFAGTGLGISGTFGKTDPNATLIGVRENFTGAELAQAVAAATGGAVAGNRVNYLDVSSAVTQNLQVAGIATQAGTVGVNNGATPVRFLVSDTAEVIAIRIAQVVNASPSITGSNISASTDPSTPNIVNFLGGILNSADNSVDGTFTVGNVSPGGLVTGLATINGVLYAVSDRGGLYAVNNPSRTGVPVTAAPGNIGSYVSTATELVGLNFSGLSSGPQNIEGGRFANLLFGVTNNGTLYAFNTLGQLQPVFAGGATSININSSTGGGPVVGIDFSTLDFNLWHTTVDPDGATGPQTAPRGNDPGHGINATDNGTRTATAGGISFHFGYESVQANNVLPASVVGIGNARLDGQQVTNTYNFPGGAKGAVESNPFSLVGYSAADLPTLYFNYFLASDINDPAINGNDHDAFRVFAISGDGTERLLTTNNFASATAQTTVLEPTFDNSNSWRQARVSLSDYAGLSNVRLRVEFSTGTFFDNGTVSLTTVAGADLSDGQTFVVSGQTFEIDKGTTLTIPSGSQLAAYYAPPANVATTRVVAVVGGVTYVLDDGKRTVNAGEVRVPVLVSGDGPLATLTASTIASRFIAAVKAHGVPATTATFDFSPEPNNEIAVATPLPTVSGNAIFSGNGRFETTLDRDLFRVEVPAGATLRATLTPDTTAPFVGRIRYFDATGKPLSGSISGTPLSYTSPVATTVYVGFSSGSNDNYNPFVDGTGTVGVIGNYAATIEIASDLQLYQSNSKVEVSGGFTASGGPDGVITATGAAGTVGIPVVINSSMTAAQVATVLQVAIANQFSGGVTTVYPTHGANISLAGLSVTNAGPFTVSGQLSSNTNAVARARSNNFEGIYVDDFLIGFAERGELVTQASANATGFVADPLHPLSGPADGTYQLEIRDASEYVNSYPGNGTRFRTFDTNDRLAEGLALRVKPLAAIIDGASFQLSDGVNTVSFEIDLETAPGISNGVTSGRVPVRIPFASQTFASTKNGSDVVAKAILNAINDPAVRALIKVSAVNSDGFSSINSDRIDLFGTVFIPDGTAIFSEIARNDLRGDANRDRTAQGTIIIENNRFLFNSDVGIELAHGSTAVVAGQSTNSVVGYPRNLVELNTERFIPGVVVQSNVIAFNGNAGIRINGQATGGSAADPVPFDRITNNTIIGGTVLPAPTPVAAVYKGTTYLAGAISFADAVTSFVAGSGVASTFANPATALGIPDAVNTGSEPVDGLSTVSLGLGGVLTVQFTDNLLTGSGDSRPDLMIYETGEIESVRVAVSRDGVSFVDVGVIGGVDKTIDLDAAGFGTQDRFAFVRLTDLRQGTLTTGPVGADIDAIGALSTATIEQFTPGGDGILVSDNSAPTLLNNVIANSVTGLTIDSTSASTVVGGTSYYRNTANTSDTPATSLGQFADVVPSTVELFTNPSNLVFTPRAGVSIIDSSIDSLEDRASLSIVRNAIGLPPTPIIAPRLDVNGQLRVDDPAVESPPGIGDRVFKDRGAEDRADQFGPRAVLISPRAEDLKQISGQVATVRGTVFDSFDFQLVDGIGPSDPTPGVGIDDASVTSDTILVIKDGVPLIEGLDYRVGYESSSNIVRITPIAGIWEDKSTYVIRLLDASDSVLKFVAGTGIADGAVTTLLTAQTGKFTDFEAEKGISISIDPSVVGNNYDGQVISIFDGTVSLNFELNTNTFANPSNIAVAIPATASTAQIATALAAAIDQSTLSLTVNTLGSVIQLLGNSSLATAKPLTPAASLFAVSGAIGTRVGFGIGLPVVGATLANTVKDGQTFTISRGGTVVQTFELNFVGGITTAGAIAVNTTASPTLDQLATAIVNAIGGSGLGLAPVNLGQGRIVLGGDANYSLDLTKSGLLQLGAAGQVASIPVVIPINASVENVTSAYATAIRNANLSGVSSQAVGDRLILDGVAAVSGVNASSLPIIRDEVGNQLQSNRSDGRTELTIFVGGGFDYGDAPASYGTTLASGGARHGVDHALTLGPTITPDADAILTDGDVDDGVALIGNAASGFPATFTIDVHADSRKFFVDVWVDWNKNGIFDATEVTRYRSSNVTGSNLPILGVGVNTVSINVPSGVTSGITYARFRLSETSGLGATGDASSGEVEDLAILVQNNPYQNPLSNADVNKSGLPTPLDALNILNLIRKYGVSNQIPLNPVPASLPEISNGTYLPDVNGNGNVSVLDALLVLNEIKRIREAARAAGEGEAFVPVSNGLFASPLTFATSTVDSKLVTVPVTAEPQTIVPEMTTTVSVFDSAPVVALDDIIDGIADDDRKTTSSETSAVDEVFSGLGLGL